MQLSVSSIYTGIFDSKLHITDAIEINPFEGIIAAAFAGLSLVHAKIFIDTFREKEEKVMSSLVLVEREWDKTRTRVMSAINLVGAVSRFFDWGADRGWFVLKTVNAVALKVLGSVTGVINYAHLMIHCLEQMKELERLGEIAKAYRICQKELFDASWYSHFSGFVANFTFMAYSGVQLVNASMGLLVASEITSMLLLAGIVMFSVSCFFRFCDNSALELDQVRLLDPRSGAPELPVYSFVGR